MSLSINFHEFAATRRCKTLIQIANLPFCSPCLFEQHLFLCSSCSCNPSLKINFYYGLNRIDCQVKVLPSDKEVVNRFFKTRLKRLSFCMQYNCHLIYIYCGSYGKIGPKIIMIMLKTYWFLGKITVKKCLKRQKKTLSLSTDA